jgi:hypothetical protein
VLPTVGTGTAPKSEEDVTQILIRDLVQKVAASLGNTIQPIEAQVAAGDDAMNRAADFMERRLWSRAIEEMEKAEPYQKPSDESYRLYNLGLAYEAMSYESKAYKEQRANLTQAQKLYDQAVEMNRAERYFVDVLRRVRDSIARYRELDAMESAGKPASGYCGGARSATTRRPAGQCADGKGRAAPARREGSTGADHREDSRVGTWVRPAGHGHHHLVEGRAAGDHERDAQAGGDGAARSGACPGGTWRIDREASDGKTGGPASTAKCRSGTRPASPAK